MSTITSEDAKALAVAYEAFLHCRRDAFERGKWGDWNAVAAWGGVLKNAQARTGAVFFSEERIDQIVQEARDKRDELPPIEH